MSKEPFSKAAGDERASRRDPVSAAEDLPESNVPISSLTPGFYLREAGTSSVHVQTLAEVAGTNKLPPILVQRHGARIIDGMHRLAAARLRGETSIRARVVNCSDEEALVLAIKANTLHGLPLSRPDRVAGAKRILSAHPDWSDRAVAEVTGLSGKTIAVLRNRSTDDIPVAGKRLGRDGKRRPVRGADGRRRALEYIQAHPEASLRQVARETDVSLGTVHDVRERLRRGADPTTRSEPARPEDPRARDRADVHADGAAAVLNRSLSATLADRPVPAKDAGSRPARRGAHQQFAWRAISPKLASDPMLRYTEGGRAFLRWMAMHATQVERWVEFVDAIPAHWAKEVCLIADTISDEWRMFAEQLRKAEAVG